MFFSFRDGLFGFADIEDPSLLAKNLTPLGGTEKVDKGSGDGTGGSLPSALKIFIPSSCSDVYCTRVPLSHR
jgi:hypothetical protein